MVGSGTNSIPVNQGIYNLEPDTEYHYRIVATNIEGTTFGNEKAFTTPPEAPQTVYVEMQGQCGGNLPCFSFFQDGMDEVESGGVVKVGEGIYTEVVVIERNVTLEFGWDAEFTTTYQTNPAIFD